MPAAETVWTAEMARALPEDGNRYEVLDGELFVTPSPSMPHQWVLMNLDHLIQSYVRTHEVGWMMMSPADITFSPRRLVQPDLFVIPASPKGRPTSWSDITDLLLVVEVLSPSTARVDRTRKRRIYQEQGVSEYWIVDVDAQLIERWRPDDVRPEIVSEELLWQPSVSIPPLRIDLRELFN